MTNRSFNTRQKRVLTACFIAYLFAYVGRLNMSATLDKIMLDMHVDAARGGTLQTIFAVIYACGQFVFGAMVDRVQPRKLMLLGLVGSAACNFSFSFAGSFSLLLGLWAGNGFFQSMLWTPIVRLMAENFEGEKKKKASFFMSFTLALGHIAAWALAGFLSDHFDWRLAYRIPAFTLLAACAVSQLILPGRMGSVKNENPTSNEVIGKMSVRELFSTGLMALLCCCVANGFVRDGVITWAPTILGAEKGMMTLIIPCVNLIGIAVGATVVRVFSQGARAVGAGMMAACVVPAIGMMLFPGASILVMALFLGVMSAILYGSNPIFTTLIPMEYYKVSRVGLVGGLSDAFIYLGSALAGFFTGWLHDATSSWQLVYALWAVCSLIGAILGFMAYRGGKKLKRL